MGSRVVSPSMTEAPVWPASPQTTRSAPGESRRATQSYPSNGFGNGSGTRAIRPGLCLAKLWLQLRLRSEVQPDPLLFGGPKAALVAMIFAMFCPGQRDLHRLLYDPGPGWIRPEHRTHSGHADGHPWIPWRPLARTLIEQHLFGTLITLLLSPGSCWAWMALSLLSPALRHRVPAGSPRPRTHAAPGQRALRALQHRSSP